MKRKKLVAGFLVVAMLISGVALAPRTAKAETSETITKENGVLYIKDSTNYDFKTYWKDNNKKAPVKENYVFGGWYTKKEGSDPVEMKPLTETTAANVSSAYAKFVPAAVLSIKSQNEAGVSAEITETTPNRSVRIISSVDSLNYREVGFEIYLNNKKELKDTHRTVVFQQLFNDQDQEGKDPEDVFHPASSHFSVWRIDNINPANDSKIIYARPYWITLDGTQVWGLAKYVHIEDGYTHTINGVEKKYISVPMNLLSGEDVAAGQVNFTYDPTVFTYEGYEAGRLLPEMYAHAATPATDATTATVNIVGNAKVSSNQSYENVKADGIYGNVRFSVDANADLSGKEFHFNVNEFCDWNKNEVTLSVWDVLVVPNKVTE